MAERQQTVASLVVDALRALEISQLFCLPGVQNDDFFDRLRDAADIRPIVTRHEQGAAYMAMGAAQATGRPAACCVVPGPGMLNAAAGLTSAYWGGANVLAIVGEIASRQRGRGIGVLHELPDQHAILRQLTKHAELVVDPSNAAAQIQAAANVLVSGPPHPVSVEVTADRWAKPAAGTIVPPTAVRPTLDGDAVAQAVALLEHAERPLVVVGGGAQGASAEVRALVERLGAPVTTRRMGHGVVDARSAWFVPITVGHDLWADADVVLGIGTRLEWPLGMWGVDEAMSIIQVNLDPAELDRHGVTSVGVLGDAAEVCRAMLDALGDRPSGAHRSAGTGRSTELAARRVAFAARIAHLEPQLSYLAAIHDVLPTDGVIVEDVTQLTFAAHLAYPFTQPRSFLSTGPAGTLGAGFAAAVGAQAALPDRAVLAVCGDGGFMFTATELATAVQHEIPVTAIVFNDGAYGNVKRIQQQRFGAERTIAADLHNPDFVQFAESFGAQGLRCDSPDGLREALAAGLAHPGPSVIEVVAGPMPDPWPFMILDRVRGQRG
jgi:acetolactate synthase-1/2/3 large subunit